MQPGVTLILANLFVKINLCKLVQADNYREYEYDCQLIHIFDNPKAATTVSTLRVSPLQILKTVSTLGVHYSQYIAHSFNVRSL